ncbi:hypothetical protein NITHO_1650015 [Nitrolancea hollandica Lb]|uniref:Uncharacterized protein n=1 Tax=Nitrolancea hollandica Lb TaxID=1129897 RepID=I4EDY4_9BACT|nr:hypothetical protein NITHO_1650015 [Nitrolancea hollandica Lb]
MQYRDNVGTKTRMAALYGKPQQWRGDRGDGCIWERWERSEERGAATAQSNPETHDRLDALQSTG